MNSLDADGRSPHCAVNSIPFPDLLQEIRHIYRVLAARKGLEFTTAIEADVPPAIVTDRLRLQELLGSLLAAAIESAREGGVALNVRRVSGGTPEDMVVAFDIVGPGGEASYQVARAASLLGGYLARANNPGGGGTLSLYLPLGAGPASD